MTMRLLFFTQPGCFSCELMKMFLEAKEMTFEELDISADLAARHAMMEEHGSRETPTLVILSGEVQEKAQQVVIGFDPVRLDQLLDPAP